MFRFVDLFVALEIISCASAACADMAFDNGETYSLTNRTVCGDMEISISTSCFREPITAAIPACIEQVFSLGNSIESPIRVKNNASYFEDSIGRNEKHIRYLSSLANGWQCLKNKDSYYLAISYGNGGNCDECEFYELIDMKGNRLTFSNNAREANERFFLKLKSLKLTGFSIDKFLEINLKPQNKSQINRSINRSGTDPN